MTQLATPLVEVAKIEVEDGFNPRTHMDPEGLKRLAASLGKTDVVQPLTVRPNGDGKFIVIAGHRRLVAAKIAGIEKVPVHVRESGDALTAALVENHHREDLDPIDTARGLKALAEELNLTTHKQIAEELAVSDSWVSQHLRLLNLPEGVQAQIAEGNVPVEAERDLREVAKVSPRVAECVCELAKRKKVKGRDFVAHFDELLVATSQARFEERPTMIDPGAVELPQVIADPKQRKELSERYIEALGYEAPLRLDEAEVDAARAAGCLVEHQVDHGEWVSTIAFITDVELAADLVVRAVDRAEKRAAEHAKLQAEFDARGNGGDPNQTPEQAKEARRAKRQEAKQRAADARRFNEELGHSLLKRRGSSSRKQHSLARAKALAAVVIADNERLAARGLRLVTPQLQDVEVKQLKSGESREKVSYAEVEQCSEYLAKRIQKAESANEVLELLSDALIASLLADEEELPQSKQVRGGIRVSQEVQKLLGADIKSVRPRRRRRKSGS